MRDSDIIWDDDADIIWDKKPDLRLAQQPSSPGLIADLLDPEAWKRQGKLAVRSLLKTPVTLTAPFVDPWKKLAGQQTSTEAFDNLTSPYLGKPETNLERGVDIANDAVVGGSPLVRGAQTVAKLGIKAPEMVRRIAAAPGTELIANATGAGAGEAARQADLPWWAQVGASMLTPMAVNATSGAVKGAGRAGKEAKNVVTRGGQEQIVADALGRYTLNKPESIRRLEQYLALKEAEKQGLTRVGVPGAITESAAVAADGGLNQARRALARGEAAPEFDALWATNNARYLDDLARMKVSPQYLEKLAQRRERVSAPLREAAFAKTKGPVNLAPVRARVERLMNSTDAAGDESQKVLRYITERLDDIEARGLTTPEHLYRGLHQDLNAYISKGIGADSNRVRLGTRAGTEIKNVLADEIDKVAPGFRKYLQVYSKNSRPIERIEIMLEKMNGKGARYGTDGAQGITTSAVMKPPGEDAAFALSHAKLRNAREAIGRELNKERLPLGNRRTQIFDRVLAASNAETLATNASKSRPGSDTYTNLAAANFGNRVVGEGLAEALPGLANKTLGLAAKPFERDIQRLQLQAFMDPETMVRLLRKSRTQRELPSIGGLKDFAATNAFGGLYGGGLLGLGQ